MYRTIIIGSSVSLQGKFLRDSDNGNVVISVGNRTYVGRPANVAA